MIRLRAAAEEEYAKSLQRVAALTEGLAEENEDDPESTFMEGVSALRADLLKKGTQVSGSHVRLSYSLFLCTDTAPSSPSWTQRSYRPHVGIALPFVGHCSTRSSPTSCCWRSWTPSCSSKTSWRRRART